MPTEGCLAFDIQPPHVTYEPSLSLSLFVARSLLAGVRLLQPYQVAAERRLDPVQPCLEEHLRHAVPSRQGVYMTCCFVTINVNTVRSMHPLFYSFFFHFCFPRFMYCVGCPLAIPTGNNHNTDAALQCIFPLFSSPTHSRIFFTVRTHFRGVAFESLFIPKGCFFCFGLFRSVPSRQP